MKKKLLVATSIILSLYSITIEAQSVYSETGIDPYISQRNVEVYLEADFTGTPYKDKNFKNGTILKNGAPIAKNIYKEIGEKYGPIDITMINIGAYDFRPMFDKSIYHTTPEEALNVAKDLKSKKVLGMHWGTFVLSLEPIMEPPIRFKKNADKFGFKKEDAITFKIGEINSLKSIVKYWF